jgi:hypothetical protein
VTAGGAVGERRDEQGTQRGRRDKIALAPLRGVKRAGEGRAELWIFGYDIE